LIAEQQAELRALVIRGPDPARHKVVRWRCLDLREEIARLYSVEVDEHTVGKWLRKLNQTRLQPRPYHPKKDAEAQEALKKLQRSDQEPAALHHLRHGDRNLVSGRGQGGPEEMDPLHLGTSRLAVSAAWDNRHDSVYLFGAICPDRGVGAAIIMPAANTGAMNEHLKEISTQVRPGAHADLI
jgi:Winged helix-turn helix